MSDDRPSTSRLFAAAALASLAFAGVAAAQPSELPPIADAQIDRFVALLRPHITKLRLPNGENVPAETPAELQRDILPHDVAREAVEVGRISGMASWCGMEWEDAVFLPMMRRLREGGGLAEKQLAFVGGLHGVVLAQFENGLRKSGECTPAHRKLVSEVLAQER